MLRMAIGKNYITAGIATDCRRHTTQRRILIDRIVLLGRSNDSLTNTADNRSGAIAIIHSAFMLTLKGTLEALTILIQEMAVRRDTNLCGKNLLTNGTYCGNILISRRITNEII